jgi:hypothetical protein
LVHSLGEAGLRDRRWSIRGDIKDDRTSADAGPVKLLRVTLVLAVIAVEAMATPEAATWRRQALVGENAEFFFRLVTVSENPAEYYSHRRTLRLEKVRKSDLQVVEQVPLRDVIYTQDAVTSKWTEHSTKPAPFDLGGYMVRNAVHLPFSDDLIRTFAIDSSGVWEVFEDGRTQIAGPADLRRQIPSLGDDPRVVGIERTDYEAEKGGKTFVYLRIWSNTAASDDDWSEDLLLVNDLVFR